MSFCSPEPQAEFNSPIRTEVEKPPVPSSGLITIRPTGYTGNHVYVNDWDKIPDICNLKKGDLFCLRVSEISVQAWLTSSKAEPAWWRGMAKENCSSLGSQERGRNGVSGALDKNTCFRIMAPSALPPMTRPHHPPPTTTQHHSVTNRSVDKSVIQSPSRQETLRDILDPNHNSNRE